MIISAYRVLQLMDLTDSLDARRQTYIDEPMDGPELADDEEPAADSYLMRLDRIRAAVWLRVQEAEFPEHDPEFSSEEEQERMAA